MKARQERRDALLFSPASWRSWSATSFKRRENGERTGCGSEAAAYGAPADQPIASDSRIGPQPAPAWINSGPRLKSLQAIYSADCGGRSAGRRIFGYW